MSLLKNSPITEKKLEAARSNGRLSQGATTPEGIERIRAANLRHGFYSKSGEEALRVLGEDPAEFEALVAGLSDPETIADTLEQELAHRLARALWRIDRADRAQEGCALRKAQQEEQARMGRVHCQMLRLKTTARNWQGLAQAVANRYYVTTADHLKLMKILHKEGMAAEASEVAVALFYQLRLPGTLGPGDPGFKDEEVLAQERAVLFRIKEIFGLSPNEELTGEEKKAFDESNRRALVEAGRLTEEQAERQRVAEREKEAAAANAHPGVTSATAPAANSQASYPQITPAEWAKREPVRQLLENILTRQVEAFNAQHHDLMSQSVKGPSAHERAAEIAPVYAESASLQRFENSSFRQFNRIMGLLIKMKREERLTRQSLETPTK